MPGTQLTLGYRFEDGIAVEINWLHLQEAKYPAQASIIPQKFNVAPDLSNTFLFSPVYNFPGEFRGEPNKVAGGPAGHDLRHLERRRRWIRSSSSKRLDIYDFNHARAGLPDRLRPAPTACSARG